MGNVIVPVPVPTPSQRLIEVISDPGRSYALCAYCPGWPVPFYSWTKQVWQVAFDQTCLLPLAPCPPPFADVQYVWMPVVKMAVDYSLKRVALDAAGNPVETMDLEVMVR